MRPSSTPFQQGSPGFCFRSPLQVPRGILQNGYILPFGERKFPTGISSRSGISVRKACEDASLAGAELTSSSFPSVQTGADPEVRKDKGINTGRFLRSLLRPFPSHLAPYLWWDWSICKQITLGATPRNVPGCLKQGWHTAQYTVLLPPTISHTRKIPNCPKPLVSHLKKPKTCLWQW